MTTTNDPYLDAGMKGWIVNTAKKEFWKVAEWYEFQDLVQDGYLCYYKCRARLHKRLLVKNPTKEQRSEVQAYVKTAFFNHISTLATKRMQLHDRAISQFPQYDDVDGEVWDNLLPSQPEEASFMTLLASAPVEIKQLVQLLASDGLDLLGFERKRYHRRAIRETSNEYFCRLLGLNPTEVDIRGRIKEYFGV